MQRKEDLAKTSAKVVARQLPGLDSLRFFAAFFVFIGHLELVKYHLGLRNSYRLFERINFGGIGVYFFFVLSGFLITWLLVKEKDKSGTIAIGAFYLRRIFRIWPLYYLILIIGFFILPALSFFDLHPFGFRQNFNLDLLLYLLVLPNLAFSMAPPVPHIGQAWSIGVEEQFYLLWPLFLKFSKNIGRTILFILLTYLLLKGVVWFLSSGNNSTAFAVFSRYLAMSKFECMMIGGFTAWGMLKYKLLLEKILFRKDLLFSSLIAFPLLSYMAFNFRFIQDVIHIPLSVCFSIIIVNVGCNPDSFLKMQWKATLYLGKVSYGFYMYHLAVLFLFVKLFKGLYFDQLWWADLAVISLAFICTFGISWLSYEYFEKYFIGWKKKFTKL